MWIGRAFFLSVLAISAATAQTPKLPDGPGKDSTVKVCGACHAAAVVATRQETREGWSAIVEDMIQRGAKGTDEEFGEAVDYLTANFPKSAVKINVNKASAKDLEAKLGITDKEAAAIVQYRQGNGGFKSIDDFKKVPGLDNAKIEAKKDRLIFADSHP